MGQALYRKHRPKKLADVVGQEHVTKTLSEALKQGRISHAYLFTGPRGVGKTSIARILAHEINGLPYDDDSAHLDIIEIDAASNRRIDEIRDLRDKVFIAPTSAKYKVYIIDEVHMLTREAFNALLKTLEEPPEHAVFILATTDAHKLPETIISRTQRFNFKPGKQDKMIDFLGALAKKEGIKISPEALELLAEHGEGSFRDSVSLLDQASSHGKAVDVVDVQELLGIPPKDALEKLLESVASGADPAQIMQALTALYQQGYQASMIAKQLGSIIREGLIKQSSSFSASAAFELMKKLLEVPLSHDPERLLEITLLAAAAPVASAVDAGPAPAKETLPEAPHASGFTPKNKSVKPAPPEADKPVPKKKSDAKEPTAATIPEAKPAENAGIQSVQLDEDTWQNVLADLKQKHNTLYSLVRMAEPEFNEEGVILKFAFAFHQKRLSETANRQRLLDIIQALTGGTVHIECVLDESAKPPVQKPAKAEQPEELSAISNIFGGGELLES
ncbi:MAG TPA: DNA polymerase III subunit gamma/tau [Candidatus Saccharimonadales bacterium]|nr:DNA polymerase III subunit gamma/tau [Candidatus Saccharimonadales bacterium]